jgi:tetratricopeptide (TPR) repeat protein
MRNTILAFATLALAAQTANAQQIVPQDPQSLRAERYATASADALARFDYPLALRAAQDGLKVKPNDGWLLYNEGAALAGLGRTDEAVQTLARAEQSFDLDNSYARGTAAYRAGLALEMAGRCEEAKRQYQHYAAIVRKSNPQMADDALRHSRMCVPGAERQNVSGKVPAR